MPYLVNGQPVPQEIIDQEYDRLSRDFGFQAIKDPAERGRRIGAAAVESAIDRILIEQAAARDLRPLDPQAFEEAFQKEKAKFNCRTVADEQQFRKFLEHQFRVMRIRQEMVAEASKPTPEEVEGFYHEQRENFKKPETFRAAHIVRHVDHKQSEEQARAAIQAALAELESGAPFAEVAEKYSDCKGNGGDLGEFPAGHMVDEFEQAIRALSPGQRTGIFTTPFGFHIAELRGRTPATAFDFEQVREKIETVFLMRNQHALYLKVIVKLRGDADIRFAPEVPACPN